MEPIIIIYTGIFTILSVLLVKRMSETEELQYDYHTKRFTNLNRIRI